MCLEKELRSLTHCNSENVARLVNTETGVNPKATGQTLSHKESPGHEPKQFFLNH